MDKTVSNFYSKSDGYAKTYVEEHSPRHRFLYDHFGLGNLKDKNIAEFGCGVGILFSMLDESNTFWGFDGADIPRSSRVSEFSFCKVDLDSHVAHPDCELGMVSRELFDVSFCMETIEHVASPFRALNNIKWMTKEGADVYITVPEQRMTHPVIYYHLFYPHTNFVDFLECMALPVEEEILFDGHFPSYIFKCKNRPWSEKKMHFPKKEEKFRDANLLEVTNL